MASVESNAPPPIPRIPHNGGRAPMNQQPPNFPHFPHREEFQYPWAAFELKPVMFIMLDHISQFNGMPIEDPHLHLRKFAGVCKAVGGGVPIDLVSCRLFQFSLAGPASEWYFTLSQEDIENWETLQRLFLRHFFPRKKSLKLMSDIFGFQQFDMESLYDTWNRFKALLKKCPDHEILTSVLNETFYMSVSPSSQMVLNAAGRGALSDLDPEEVYKIIEECADYNHQWHPDRRSNPRHVASVSENEAISGLISKFNEMLQLMKGGGSMSQVGAPSQVAQCEIGGDVSHDYDDCKFNTQGAAYVNEQISNNHHVTTLLGQDNHNQGNGGYGNNNQGGQGCNAHGNSVYKSNNRGNNNNGMYGNSSRNYGGNSRQPYGNESGNSGGYNSKGNAGNNENYGNSQQYNNWNNSNNSNRLPDYENSGFQNLASSSLDDMKELKEMMAGMYKRQEAQDATISKLVQDVASLEARVRNLESQNGMSLKI